MAMQTRKAINLVEVLFYRLLAENWVRILTILSGGEHPMCHLGVIPDDDVQQSCKVAYEDFNTVVGKAVEYELGS